MAAAPIDPEAFGRAIGEAIRDAVEPLNKRIADLETQTAHHEKHLMTFAGNWDLENNYREGSVAIFKGIVYIAGRDIAAGKADPPRQGSGWIRIV